MTTKNKKTKKPRAGTWIGDLIDRVDDLWDSKPTQRRIGALLVLVGEGIDVEDAVDIIAQMMADEIDLRECVPDWLIEKAPRLGTWAKERASAAEESGWDVKMIAKVIRPRLGELLSKAAAQG